MSAGQLVEILGHRPTERDHAVPARAVDVREQCRDLGVELVDRNTGEQNLGKKILGFMANTIAIRSNNPGRPGQAPHVGILDQELVPEDPFFKLIWIALRDGLAEIAARIG